MIWLAQQFGLLNKEIGSFRYHRKDMYPATIEKRLAFVVIVLLIDFVFVAALASGMEPIISSRHGAVILMGILLGFFMGQIAFVLIWSGFLCQTWIRSFFQAMGLALLAVYLILNAGSLGSDFRWSPANSGLYLLLIVPLYAIAGTVPLWIFRNFRGWKLESTKQTSCTSPTMGIEDILHLTAIIASSIMLSRTGDLARSEGPSNTESSSWPMLLASAAIFGLVFAPITLLSTSFCTSARSADRGVKTVVLALATFGVLFVATMALSQGTAPPEVFVFTGICCLFGYGTLWLGLSAIIADGLQLTVRGKPVAKQNATEAPAEKLASPIEESPFVDVPLAVAEKMPKVLDRILVAVFVSIVVLLGIRETVQ